MKRPSCADLAELRSAYVDEALAGSDRNRLLAHLSDCADCRAEVAELRVLREVLGAGGHQVPTDLSSRLVSIAGSEAQEPLWARPFRRTAMGTLPSQRKRLRRRTTCALIGFGAAFLTVTGIGYASAPAPSVETISDPSSEAQADFSAMLGQLQLTTDSVNAVLLSRDGLSSTAPGRQGVAAMAAPYRMLDAASARKQIKRAARAADQISYSGAQYYRATLFGQSFIANVQVSAYRGQGSRLEVYNLAGQKILSGYLPAEVRAGVVGDDLLDLLQHNYELTGWVGGTVAGRHATVVEARSTGVVVSRWWVDRQTGLLLRQQRFDRTGRPVMESGFDRVSIRSGTGFQDHLPQRSVVPTTTIELPRDDAPRLAGLGWSAPTSLRGLALLHVRVDRATDPTALQLLYSDGLSAVSVCQQRGVMASPPADSRWDAAVGAYVRHGTGNVASWQSGDVVYTVVTDGSSQLFDEAVRALPHGGAAERTTMERVRAGWAKLMAQVKR